MNSINKPNFVSRKARIPVTMGDRVIGEIHGFDPAVILEGREIQKIYEIGSKKRHFLPGRALGVSIRTIATDEMAYVAEIPVDVPNKNNDVFTEEALKDAMKKIESTPMRPATLFLSESSALDLASMMIKERESALANSEDVKILDTINKL